MKDPGKRSGKWALGLQFSPTFPDSEDVLIRLLIVLHGYVPPLDCAPVLQVGQLLRSLCVR